MRRFFFESIHFDKKQNQKGLKHQWVIGCFDKLTRFVVCIGGLKNGLEHLQWGEINERKDNIENDTWSLQQITVNKINKLMLMITGTREILNY